VLFAAALILLVVALTLAGSAWAQIRASDRYIDELAEGLDPGVEDALTEMLAGWQSGVVDTPFDDEALAHRVEQWRRGVVDTTHDPDRG
jgi:hypothetical protein